MSSFELAKNAFLNGLSLLEQGKFSKAEQQFKESLTHAPNRPSTLINLSIALINLQKWDEAKNLLNTLIEIEPTNAEAFFYLGLTEKQLSQTKVAIEHLNQTVKIRPQFLDAWLLLVDLLDSQGLSEETLRCYDALLSINPQFAEGWINKGLILSELSKHQEAADCYQQALHINPQSEIALSNYGASLSHLGKLSESISIYTQAIAQNPNNLQTILSRGNAYASLEKYAEAITDFKSVINKDTLNVHAHLALGNAQVQMDLFQEALQAYEKVIANDPQNSQAYANQGATLSRLYQFEKALPAYEIATKLNTQDFQSWSNMGVALHALQRHQESLAAYDKAIAIKPDYAEAWSNKGITLNDLKRYEEALAAYDKAIAIKPDYAEAWSNKGITLNDLKRYEEALAAYDRVASIKPDMDLLLGTRMHLKMRMCDWKDYEQNLQALEESLQQGKNAIQPFLLLSLIEDLSLQQRAAQFWINAKAPEKYSLPPIAPPLKKQKIRVGYYSADFRIHPVAFLIAGVFEHHDKNQFEIFGFSYGPNTDDEMRHRLEKSFDRFIDISNQSDLEVAALSRDLGIDIAVDLTSITQFNRLGIFSHRAAPIQINYLGYPGTSGANYFDYLIADNTVITTSEENYFNEKIIYLPHSYQANDQKRPISEKSFSRSDCGLPENGFVFCCFNNNYKITPDVFDIWMNILQRVPKSVLWLFEDNEIAKNNLKAEAAIRGVESSRLIFAPHMSPSEHLARQRLADLFLDTAPYNAHTTASDALWTGLPVLTKMGGSFPGRVAASLLKAVGLPELITNSNQGYEELAVEL